MTETVRKIFENDLLLISEYNPSFVKRPGISHVDYRLNDTHCDLFNEIFEDVIRSCYKIARAVYGVEVLGDIAIRYAKADKDVLFSPVHDGPNKSLFVLELAVSDENVTYPMQRQYYPGLQAKYRGDYLKLKNDQPRPASLYDWDCHNVFLRGGVKGLYAFASLDDHALLSVEETVKEFLTK